MNLRRLSISSLALAIAALAALPASAEWLVTRDGARVETQGEYTVKGRLVIFTAKNGTLSSLPAEEVDLEATAVLKEAMRRAAERPPTPETPGEAVWVLTDRDIPRYRPEEPLEDRVPGLPGAAAAPEAATEGEEAPAPAATGEPIRVTGWEEVEDFSIDGLVLAGTLGNESADMASGILLSVRVFDSAGELLESRYAEVDSKTIGPGEETQWRVAFPDVLSFASVRFGVQSTRFAAGPGADTGEEDDFLTDFEDFGDEDSES